MDQRFPVPFVRLGGAAAERTRACGCWVGHDLVHQRAYGTIYSYRYDINIMLPLLLVQQYNRAVTPAP